VSSWLRTLCVVGCTKIKGRPPVRSGESFGDFLHTDTVKSLPECFHGFPWDEKIEGEQRREQGEVANPGRVVFHFALNIESGKRSSDFFQITLKALPRGLFPPRVMHFSSGQVVKARTGECPSRAMGCEEVASASRDEGPSHPGNTRIPISTQPSKFREKRRVRFAAAFKKPDNLGFFLQHASGNAWESREVTVQKRNYSFISEHARCIPESGPNDQPWKRLR